MGEKSEKIIKREISEYLKTVEGLTYFRKNQMAGDKVGIADIICCYKGKYVEIEVKQKTGIQSDVQKVRQKHVEQHDGIYILADCVEKVKEVLEK